MSCTFFWQFSHERRRCAGDLDIEGFLSSTRCLKKPLTFLCIDSSQNRPKPLRSSYLRLKAKSLVRGRTRYVEHTWSCTPDDTHSGLAQKFPAELVRQSRLNFFPAENQRKSAANWVSKWWALPHPKKGSRGAKVLETSVAPTLSSTSSCGWILVGGLGGEVGEETWPCREIQTLGPRCSARWPPLQPWPGMVGNLGLSYTLVVV